MIRRIVVTYFIFSVLWVFFSDRVVGTYVTHPVLLTQIQTYKGWAFVLASAGLIAFLLYREQSRRLISETRFQAAIESLPFEFWMMDSEGRYIQQNAASLEHWGNRIGKRNIETPIPREIAALWDQNNLKAFRGESVRAEVAIPEPDGEIYYQYAIVCPIQYQRENHGILGVDVDITTLHKREAELRILNRITTTMRDLTDPAAIQRLALESVNELFRLKCAALVLVDMEKREITNIQASGGWESHSGMRAKLSEYPVFEKMLNSQTAHIDDAPPMGPGFLFSDATCRSLISVPLIANKRTLGVVLAGRDKPFLDEEARLVNAIADLAANALDRAILNEEKETHLRQLTSFHAIDKAITSSLNIRVTMNVVLDQMAGQPHVDATDAYLYSTQSGELEYSGSHGFPSSVMHRTRIPMGAGLAGQVASGRKPIIIPDLPGNHDFTIQHIRQMDGEFKGYVGLPMVSKGKVKGIIEVYSRSVLSPDQSELDFLKAIATQGAIAVDNAELFEQLQRSNFDLTQSYDATIEGWSRALELKDRETEGHTRRVTEWTLDLARRLGTNEEELIHLRRGVLLHDIGKMAIPDDILLKPGPLTDEEWKVMKRHPIYAYELLSPIPYLHPALDIPYNHHEHWDGSGYPRGLSGDDIPYASRVFSVIDVWDALRNDRPYRYAWPENRVLKYIRDHSGKLFDPKITEAFLEQFK